MSEVVPAVKALIRKEGEFLLLKKPRSIHQGFLANDVPGGKMLFGESPLEVLRREVREETGLGIRILQPVHMVTLARDGERQVVATVFLCEADGEVTLSREHDGFLWAGKGRILRGNFPAWIKECIRRCGP